MGEIMAVPKQTRRKPPGTGQPVRAPKPPKPRPGPRGLVRLEWPGFISKKVVGVDISVLLHTLVQTRDIKTLLFVNSTSSVFYFVAHAMQTWFNSHKLFHAAAIVFVFDPTVIEQWHCSDCKARCQQDLAVKYDLTNRTKQKATREAHRIARGCVGVFSPHNCVLLAKRNPASSSQSR